MLETILTALDGSDHSDKAVHLASDIAAKYEARLVFLHVKPEGPLPESLRHLADIEFAEHKGGAPVSPLGRSGYEDARVGSSDLGPEWQRASEIYSRLAEQIMTSAKAIAEEHNVSTVECRVETGDPTQAILDQAEDISANLIVMGSRGLSDLKGLLLGSISHKVSHLAPCTCVTVR